MTCREVREGPRKGNYKLEITPSERDYFLNVLSMVEDAQIAQVQGVYNVPSELLEALTRVMRYPDA